MGRRQGRKGAGWGVLFRLPQVWVAILVAAVWLTSHTALSAKRVLPFVGGVIVGLVVCSLIGGK